ncbi:MAG: hypothetical protein ABEJ28_00900 [Salinigranum sp.]
MPSDRACPDCGEAMERMTLRGSSAVGELSVVSEKPDTGFLSGIRADEILTPIPYVCPDCRRILLYAED